jgi:hypothetical protein
VEAEPHDAGPERSKRPVAVAGHRGLIGCLAFVGPPGREPAPRTTAQTGDQPGRRRCVQQGGGVLEAQPDLRAARGRPLLLAALNRDRGRVEVP